MEYAGARLGLEGDLTKDGFFKLYKRCKKIKSRDRYHALYLGFTYPWKEVAGIIGVSYRTVLMWAKLYNKNGLEGLDPDSPKGRESSLGQEELDEIKRIVSQSPRDSGFKFSNWTAARVAGWIASKLNVMLSAERARQVLHGIGFSYIKPIYSYIKADKTERKRFLEGFGEVMESNEVVLFEDESSVDQHPGTHGMWVLKGTRKEVKTFGTHAKRHVFAAADPKTGSAFSRVTRRLTADNFVKFLGVLVSRLTKPFTLVLDSSPCHTAKIVKEFFEKHKRIKVVWLPKYSPDLNPIEHVWKDMKFDVTHNYMFGTVNRLAWGLKGVLQPP